MISVQLFYSTKSVDVNMKMQQHVVYELQTFRTEKSKNIYPLLINLKKCIIWASWGTKCTWTHPDPHIIHQFQSIMEILGVFFGFTTTDPGNKTL